MIKPHNQVIVYYNTFEKNIVQWKFIYSFDITHGNKKSWEIVVIFGQVSCIGFTSALNDIKLNIFILYIIFFNLSLDYGYLQSDRWVKLFTSLNWLIHNNSEKWNQKSIYYFLRNNWTILSASKPTLFSWCYFTKGRLLVAHKLTTQYRTGVSIALCC